MSVPSLGSIESIRAALVLQAGSDPQRVEALRIQMIGSASAMKSMGYGLIFIGFLISLTLIGAFIGLPMAVVGIGVVWRTRKLTRNVNEASQQYLASLQTGG